MFKVIIADDEKIVRIAMQNIIPWEKYGFKIIGLSKNGKEVLEVLEEKGGDLIITDLKMGNMNGIELISYLKKINFKGEIIVLSNYGDYELVRKAMKEGAYDYLLKITITPTELIDLLKSINNILNKRIQHSVITESEKVKNDYNKSLNSNVTLRKLLINDITLDTYKRDYTFNEYRFAKDNNRFLYIYIDKYRELYSEKIKDKDNLSLSIINIINECLSNINHNTIQINNHKYIVLGEFDNDKSMKLAVNIQKTINLYMNFKVSILISKEFYNIEELKVKFDECEEIRKKNLINKEFIVVRADNYKNVKEYKREINKIIDYVNNNIDKRITLVMVSKFVNMNESYLSRLFKNETGKNLMYFINEVKMEKAKELLKEQELLVKDVANKVGIQDQFYFNRVFKKFYGMSPTLYKKELS